MPYKLPIAKQTIGRLGGFGFVSTTAGNVVDWIVGNRRHVVVPRPAAAHSVMPEFVRKSGNAMSEPSDATPMRGTFIQGCARSGNTLFRELCATGFEKTEPLHLLKEQTECSLEFLIAATTPLRQENGILLASWNRDASLAMDAKLLQAHPEIKVVSMLRRPFDILTSVHNINPGAYCVAPERLIAGLHLCERFKADQQVSTIRHEDVALRAEEVQRQITSAFGLKPIRSFTECYKHFSDRRRSIVALHAIRPIDATSVGRWKRNPEQRECLRGVLERFTELTGLSQQSGDDLEFDPEDAPQ
jgi:hypothetical protein